MFAHCESGWFSGKLATLALLNNTVFHSRSGAGDTEGGGEGGAAASLILNRLELSPQSYGTACGSHPASTLCAESPPVSQN